MRKILMSLILVFIVAGCGVEDDIECTDSIDCPGTQVCIDGVCVDDTGNSGNSGDSGNTGNTGNSGDTGNTGNSGDSGNSGNSGDTGNTGNTGDTGNSGNSGDTGDTGSGPACGNEIVDGDEVCDGNRLKCNEIEGMGYVNDAEVLCTTFCDAWITTDCKCAAGFEKDADGLCVDIDECVKETDNCAAEGSECTNTEGSFTCTCAENYEGDGLVCTFCDQNDKCGAGCSACSGDTLYCMDNGDSTSQCVECYQADQCDTVAGEFCTANHVCSLCPLPLTVATWDSGDDGWTKDGAWVNKNSKMEWGSSTKYNSSYTHNLTYGTETVLTHCVNAGVSFTISLSDDTSWESESGTDKNQRLYVECSGNGGTDWVSMTPPTLPSAQTKNSGCTTYYCDGNQSVDRSFSAVAQTWMFPAGCIAPNALIRFRANGSSAWELYTPGWTVDTVEMKEF